MFVVYLRGAVDALSLQPSLCGHMRVSIFTSPPPHSDLPYPLCLVDIGELLR